MTLMEMRNKGRGGDGVGVLSHAVVILKRIITPRRCMQEAVEHEKHAPLQKTNNKPKNPQNINLSVYLYLVI